MVFTKTTLNFLFITLLFFFFKVSDKLDSASLTACLDIVLWLLALNELQKNSSIFNKLFL